MKKWFLIIGLLAVVGTIFGMYSYMNGRDGRLYEEALVLESEGAYRQAHEKVIEALDINPKNKKILVYKTKLFNIVQNLDFLDRAVKNRDDGVRAMNRGDYVTASEKLDAALGDVASVSPSVLGYTDAMELQKQLLKDTERLLKEAPEKYYIQAVGFSQNGEYERAYTALEYILKPESKVVSLKNELAYRIGSEKYNECVSNQYPTSFLLRDAIMWLSRVSPGYKDANNVKNMINNLKSILGNVEKQSKQ